MRNEDKRGRYAARERKGGTQGRRRRKGRSPGYLGRLMGRWVVNRAALPIKRHVDAPENGGARRRIRGEALVKRRRRTDETKVTRRRAADTPPVAQVGIGRNHGYRGCAMAIRAEKSASLPIRRPLIQPAKMRRAQTERQAGYIGGGPNIPNSLTAPGSRPARGKHSERTLRTDTPCVVANRV